MKVLIADRSKLLIDYAEGLISKYNVSQTVCSDYKKINETQFKLSHFDTIILFNKNGFLDYSRIKRFMKDNKEIKLLIVCFNMDRNIIIELARLGIKGLVDGISADKIEFVNAVKLIGNNESFFSQSIHQILMNQFKRKEIIKRGRYSDISEREFSILKLISDGFSNFEISKKLNISEYTVKNHRNNLLKKMQVKNTAQMIKKACTNDHLPLKVKNFK